MPITAELIVMAALQELGKREISIPGSENSSSQLILVQLSSALCKVPWEPSWQEADEFLPALYKLWLYCCLKLKSLQYPLECKELQISTE